MWRRLATFGSVMVLACAGVQAGRSNAAPGALPRARAVGIEPGVFSPGKKNSLTDVPGVKVGHVTVNDGEIQTGATAVFPHGGNLFADKVPAAIVVHNGFGKLVGYSQVDELGELETPIVLTNTLSVWDAASAVVTYMLALPGNETVRSINPVVGETNDGRLNDIRGRHLTPEHFRGALTAASADAVPEGSVGAGRGTVAFGYKGGIGSASRVVPGSDADHTVGVLVQSNFGGVLAVDGVPVGKATGRHAHASEATPADGSCMIVLATDAPLDARQLRRLARRTFAGMARTGASFSHGSGDYAIAFSTAPDLRRGGGKAAIGRVLPDDQLSPLFQAAAEATEEAIYNSMLQATPVSGPDGKTPPVLRYAVIESAREGPQ